MSAVSHCGDNAAMEGFFGLLKRERVNRRRYRQAEARADVFVHRALPITRACSVDWTRGSGVYSLLTQPSVKTG